jgi:hypothetical protein
MVECKEKEAPLIDVEKIKERITELSKDGMEEVQKYLKTVIKLEEDGTFVVPDELKGILLSLEVDKKA